ncbi:DUF4132 domain-containing protein [Actinomadura macrotermitis]|uniref:DUF4132 domain-containing protein n=1 Tax=Actinomadura macrotermitis TaxID=2585200 RepID=A0A7K0C2I3_9ACTN|nr:DUF4132 domain-containing protein [Actinomadura macrotermitis]MQY07633.1 hypothetical protein [Actinomadura macrotermitis]
MLHELLARETLRGDGLDDLRLAALDRTRWLSSLLDLQRETSARRDACYPLTGRRRARWEELTEVMRVRAAEIDERLIEGGDADRKAALLFLVLADHIFDLQGDWPHPAAGPLIDRVGGWTPREIALLLRRIAERDDGSWSYRLPLNVARSALRTADTATLRELAAPLRAAHDAIRDDAAAKELLKLRVIAEGTDLPDGFVAPRSPWAEPLLALTGAADLLWHLKSLTSPRPSQRWRARCADLIEETGAAEALTEVVRRLAEDEPRSSVTDGVDKPWYGDHEYTYLVHDADSDVARGAIWAAALGTAPVELLHALVVRAGTPPYVYTDPKLASAAANALGAIDDPAALAALTRLAGTLRHRGVRKQVDTAIRAASERQGITPRQLAERSVPTHGLAADGTLTRQVDGHQATLAIADAHTVRLTYTSAEGRTTRTPPAAIKDSAGVRELKALAKQVRGTLSAARARIEAVLSTAHTWTYDEWRRHYLEHPVVGAVARALIWEIDGEAVLPALKEVPPGAEVRLWHPIRATTDEVRAWRTIVTVHEVRQPFKQAFREIYLLTPAEEATRVYSNRFAAHIVRYPQLYALIKGRDWQTNHLGSYDGGHDGTARGVFGDGQWRACLHHEAAEQDERDWRPAYAVTDQVRFERAHGNRWAEAPLADVPAEVFSEAMRDIDLFIAVTSIATDPDWIDRGERRHHDYWRTASFGPLTPSAESRRDVLARLLPRTRIADRCTLDGRFLVVRGDLRTYRIHLGSANILMEPDDTYLCIVEAPGRKPGKVFLPFEDERLSLILSKAFLLAADTTITDETILTQLKRGA